MCGRTGCTRRGTPLRRRSSARWAGCCWLRWRRGTWGGGRTRFSRNVAGERAGCDDRRMTIALLFLVAAAADAGRPALFFREDFKETPAATPITQEHIANA